jgi:hypothetical protein
MLNTKIKTFNSEDMIHGLLLKQLLEELNKMLEAKLLIF